MAYWGFALLSLACIILSWPGASATSATRPGVIRGEIKKAKKCVPSKKKKCPKKKPSAPVKAEKTWDVDEKYTIENGCSRKCWPIGDDNFLSELDLEVELSSGDCDMAGFVAKADYEKVSLKRKDEQGTEACNAVWENADSEDFKKFGVLEYKDSITVGPNDDSEDIKDKELKGEDQKVICVGAVAQCTSGEVEVKFNTNGPATGGLIAGIVIGCVCLIMSIGVAIYSYVAKVLCFASEEMGEKAVPMLVNDVEAGSSSSSSSSSDAGGDDGGSD